jgi:hypothetical protein
VSLHRKWTQKKRAPLRSEAKERKREEKKKKLLNDFSKKKKSENISHFFGDFQLNTCQIANLEVFDQQKRKRVFL